MRNLLRSVQQDRLLGVFCDLPVLSGDHLQIMHNGLRGLRRSDLPELR